MAGIFGLGGSAASTVAGASVAAVAVAGGIAAVTMLREAPAPEAAPTGGSEGVAVEADRAPAAVAPAAGAGGAAEPVASTPPPPTEPGAIAPSFDVVRVDAAGSALIAGRGLPRAEVKVMIDGTEAYRAATDADGAFAAMFDVPVVDVPRVVSLVMERPGAEPVKSAETVILAPPVSAAVTNAPAALEIVAGLEPSVGLAPGAAELQAGASDAADLPASPAPVLEDAAAPEALPALERGAVPPLAASTPVDPAETAIAEQKPEPEPDPVATPEAEPAAEPQPVAPPSVAEAPAIVAPAQEAPAETAPVAMGTAPGLSETPDVPGAPSAIGTSGDAESASDRPAAPTVLMADETGLRVLQPGGTAPEAADRIVIDTISYTPDGEVALGGRGAGAGFVRVYLDNRPIKTVRIDALGQWRTPLPEVDTGVYTLRVDELNAQGEVTSRVETPFQREEPALVAALDTRDDASETGVVTVQPGNTLWGIATETYGEGLMYVRLFRANRDRIRNPDLIYPGQVFEIPEG